jgi:hypothetical protein
MKHCFYGAHVVMPEYHLSSRCPCIVRPNGGYRYGKQVVISSYETLADAIIDGHVKLCEMCAKGKLFNVLVNDNQRQVWLSERDHRVLRYIGKALEAGDSVMPKVIAKMLAVDRIDVVKSFNLLQKMGLITRGHERRGYGNRGLSPVGAAVYEMDKYLEAQKAKSPGIVHPYPKI